MDYLKVHFPYQNLKPELAEYLPVIRELQNAGWNPMNYIAAKEDSILIERFGSIEGGNLMFTIWNSSETFIDMSLWFDKAGLGLSGDESFEDVLTVRDISS